MIKYQYHYSTSVPFCQQKKTNVLQTGVACGPPPHVPHQIIAHGNRLDTAAPWVYDADINLPPSDRPYKWPWARLWWYGVIHIPALQTPPSSPHTTAQTAPPCPPPRGICHPFDGSRACGPLPYPPRPDTPLN